MKKLLSLSLVAVLTMGAVGLSGCASDDPTLFAIPAEIEPRPALDSVPDDTAFVAQMSGPGGFEYSLGKGQRYYLVDLEADRVIKSGVAPREGRLQVGEKGASFAGDEIWEGDTAGAMKIGLFVARRPEQV